MTGSPTFDRTDLRLLALLQRQGRASNAELAAQVNLSPSACLRRVQRLEAEGVVAGYAARLVPGAAIGTVVCSSFDIIRRYVIYICTLTRPSRYYASLAQYL